MASGDGTPGGKVRVVFMADKIFGRVVDLLAAAAGVAVALLLVAYVREIIGRYFFNSPTTWVDEMASYTVAGVTFLGAAYALRKGELVSVSLVSDRLPELWKEVTQGVGLLISAFVLAIVTYNVAQFVWQVYEDGILSNTVLHVPQWMPRTVMLIGLVILFIEVLRQAIRAIARAIRIGRA